MILCTRCKRLWPSGTIWCGNCRVTLGKRICEEGHENFLTSQSCATCGSNRLSKGVPSRNLRPLTWLVVSIVGVVVFPLILSLVTNLMQRLWCLLLHALLPPLISLAFISILLGAILGENARKYIGSIWSWIFQIAFQFLRALASILLNLLRRKEKAK